MLVPLVLLFILVPIAELAIIIQVGQALGLLATIAILIADSLLGSLLMRSQGRAAWRRFNVALQSGRPPAREVLDGVLVIFGGALLLTPGFITDVVGLAFLLPPSRAVLRRLLVRRFAHRMVVAAGTPRRRAPRDAAADVDVDVEGSAIDVDPGALPPRRP
ncbi:MAG TPA: FxsA family protein [Solirubrobacteraceae bacterium]|nr:FxsA family protein [Solirubrobacteraceae bacterium]